MNNASTGLEVPVRETYVPKDSGWLEHLKAFSHNLKTSPKLILVIVFIALFLDNMLLTTVVPIIPNYLLSISLKNSKYDHDLSQPCSHYLHTLVDYTTSKGPNETRITRFGTKGFASKQSVELTFNVKSLDEEPSVLRSKKVRQQTEKCSAEQKRGILHKFNKTLHNENVYVGFMFASKSIVQMITNPFVGPLTNKIGYSVPLFTGFIIMLLSTIAFAFSSSYVMLVFARAMQGAGSAFTSVSGMGLLATYYPDDNERGKAFSLALSGLAMGVLVGPPFGGVLYEFSNKATPFLILAGLALFDGLLQLLAMKPSIRPEAEKGSSLMELIRDPYILIAAGSITFGNMGIGLLEPSLPIWMRETMDATGWQQGVAFLPCSISYLIGTNLFGVISQRIGRWLSSLLGMLIEGICLMIIPLSKNFYMLIVPNFMLGFAIGMIDSSMMPIMAHLVDLRHAAVYGSVYAIADVAFCLSFCIGPVLSSALVSTIGFPTSLRLIALVTLLYAPLNLYLRDPPVREKLNTNDAPLEDLPMMMNNKETELAQIQPQPYYDGGGYQQVTPVPYQYTDVMGPRYGYGDDYK